MLARLSPIPLAISVAACQFLRVAPTLTCVDLPREQCERQAADLIATSRVQQPKTRIVSIRLTANDGGEIHFDDGTATMWMP